MSNPLVKKTMQKTASAVSSHQKASAEQILSYNGYRIGKTLGDGAYAKVKEAYSQKHDKNVAVKIINRRLAPDDFRTKFLPRELEIIRHVRHPNIIRIYALLNHEEKVCVVMEKAAHGDLLEHIKKNGSLPEGICKSMFRQLVDGLKYLHAKDVVHRDLKCENLLLDECDHLKVADFGFARVISDTKLSETFCGSAAYAPPEILQGIPYHPKSAEIWSMGVILYIMLVGMMPYDDSDVKAMIKVQLNSKVSFPEKKKLTPEVKALVHWMLEPRLDKRASLDDILASDWFNS